MEEGEKKKKTNPKFRKIKTAKFATADGPSVGCYARKKKIL